MNRSIFNGVNYVRYAFDIRFDYSKWIQGSPNIADIGTKTDSFLSKAIWLTFATSILQFDMSACEVSTREHFIV